MPESELSISLGNFLKACPREFPFPMGGNTFLPLKSEFDLGRALQEAMPLSSECLISLRTDLTISQAESLVIFAVRWAVLAVRTRSASLIDIAIHALLLDDGLVEWRDLLRCLAIIEDCASRVGANVKERMENIRELAGERFKQTVFADYLTRPPEMRTIKVMRFIAKDTPEGIIYVSTM